MNKVHFILFYFILKGNWDTIDTQTNNATINGAGQSVTCTVNNNQNKAYSTFKITQTGVSTHGDNHFLFCGFEVYGSVNKTGLFHKIILFLKNSS